MLLSIGTAPFYISPKWPQDLDFSVSVPITITFSFVDKIILMSVMCFATIVSI